MTEALQPSTLSLFLGPQLEPLTVQEAKDWARITEDDDDATVERLVSAARAHVEELTGRALITQTWDFYLDAFPCWGITVPRPKLQTVTTLKYTDSNGVQQTLASSEYTVDARKEPGQIVPAYGKTWPSTRSVPNAVEIRFVAGYGTAADTVPFPLRQAIAVLVATMYENREALSDTVMPAVPMAFWQLIDQHRVWTL